MREKKIATASAGNRTRINCLEGSYADHYTTDAVLSEDANLDGFHASKLSGEMGSEPRPISDQVHGPEISRSPSWVWTVGASIAQWQSVGLVNQRS